MPSRKFRGLGAVVEVLSPHEFVATVPRFQREID